MFIGVASVESNDCSCLNPIVLDDVLDHLLCIIEELLGFHTNSLIIEYLRIGSVWVLASDLPGLEERIPIDVGDQLGEVVGFVDFIGANYAWSDDLCLVPVDLHLLGSCFAQ